MNNISYIIDESGDTGYTKKSSRYFIITAIHTTDFNVMRLIAKKIHRNKKDKKKRNGLHAHFESYQTKHKLITLLKNQLY